MAVHHIIDAHEDIAWNVLTFGRDYTRSAAETRRLEKETQIPLRTGDALLGWPEYQSGGVLLVFGTLFASPIRRRPGDWATQSYADYDQAHQMYMAQVNVYNDMAETHSDKFRTVKTVSDLNAVLLDWESPQEGHPVGLVILMEGAEGVRTPGELEEWWRAGVRIIAPAWAGTRFCGGTREPGPLTDDGRALLMEMSALGFTLDLSHMDEQAALQALDCYPGAMIVSHANAAALIANYAGNRLLGDNLIKRILSRDGIIGVVPYCRFLRNDWKPEEGRDNLTLETLADHIDHICQLAGDVKRVGIGSDFDGGFGLSAAPADVDTVADLQRLVPILSNRGYTDTEISAVLSANWLRHLKDHLPGQ